MSGSRPNRAASAPAAAVRSAHADRTLSVDRAATLAARALLIVGRAAELTTALAQALDDGRITDAELDALRPLIGRLDRVLNPLRAVGDA